MAITSVGSLGTSSVYDTNRSLSLTPSSTVPAGNVVVVWYAQDSVFSIFVPTDGQYYWRCTDTAGNIYTTLGSMTDQEPFFQQGAACAMFISELRNDLTTGDTITCETDPNFAPGQTWARAMSAEEFDFGGMHWAAANSTYALATNSGPPALVTYDTQWGDIEWLWLYALGSEGPNTDSYTMDPDYTQIASAGTNTGTATQDMSIFGSYLIDNISSDSFSVTPSGSNRKVTQVFRPIAAVPHVDGFPTTPILDDFNRANENPLDGGLWDTGPFAYGSAHLQLLSNEARGASGTFQGGSFFLGEMESCVEVYVTFVVDNTGSVHYHSINNSATATMEGYGAGWARAPFEQSQDYFDHINFGSTGLQGSVHGDQLITWLDLHAGFRLGCQMSFPTALPGAFTTPTGIHHLWADFGDGWTWLGAYIDDRPVTGRLALGIQNGFCELDDFGGGEFVCPPVGRQQIYRILRGKRIVP